MKKLLIDSWNKIFNASISSDELENSNDIDKLFNDYLRIINKDIIYVFREDICLVERLNYKYYIYYSEDNKLNKTELDVRSKRKLFSLLNNYNTIITKNFPLQNNFTDNKIILRYELIQNLFTSNNTHYFSADLPFPADDYRIFFVDKFYNMLLNNTARYNLLKFSSLLLNHFENGITVDEFILKPDITVSHYGRWYWTNTEKIQTSLRIRNKLYSKIIKYGKVLNIDFISAEPNLLSQLHKSELMKKLVKYRILIKRKDPELSDIIKNLLNIYIHSNDPPEIAAEKFRQHNADKIKDVFGIAVLDILTCLQEDLLCYNKYIIDEYRSKLYVEEFYRRIVIPNIPLLEDGDIIKEHRKFLQGHVHDHVLELARLLYEDLNILPIFTIHDSLSYFISNGIDIDAIKTSLRKNLKSLKLPIELEVIS